MLYRIQDGPCTQSFGVFVAQSAGFPKEVIQEAKRKAHVLEGKAHLDEEEEDEEKDDDKKDGNHREEGRSKMRKMKHHLEEFANTDIPSLGVAGRSEELQSILKKLFPKEMLISN
jgi:DNA mismatch repair protein MSH2